MKIGNTDENGKHSCQIDCGQIATLRHSVYGKMNPMTNVKNIKKLSEEELRGKNRTSWHDQYRSSAWLFIGGLPYDLTEGDIICVFSQFGEPVNVNLVRDKDTGKSKGFCFLCYEDQRSTDLAVDNFNGIKLLGRTIRVDHVENYKPPKNTKVSDEKRETTSTAAKEKESKENLNSNEYDSLADKTSEKNRPLKKKKKKRRESESDAEDSSEKKRKKVLKTQKKRKNSKGDSYVSSDSEKKKSRKQKYKSSDSDSSTSSSSSLSSDESVSDDSDTKNKRKIHKSQLPRRNRTAADLKREAKLIHAELKRRQRLEEREKKTRRESDEERRRKRDSKTLR